MAIKALLYSADGADQEPELEAIDVAKLTDRDLLWIDLASPDEAEVNAIAARVGCDPKLLRAGPGGTSVRAWPTTATSSASPPPRSACRIRSRRRRRAG
jgi:hypothetical protein